MASTAVAITIGHSVSASVVGDHLADADLDGLHVVARGDQERPEILIPAEDEQDHEQRRHVGARQRQERIPEEAEGAGAVDARGFQKLVRHRHEELAEQQRCGRGCDQRQRQAGIAVEHVQVGDDLVGWIDADLDRKHQGDEDEPEQRHPEREAEINDRIGRDDRDHDLADRDQERHHQRVQHHVADRLARRSARADEDGLIVGLEEKAAGQQRHLPVGDHRVVLRRGDEGQVDREGDDRDADPEDDVGNVTPKAFFLDHQ
ncbi:hypothetical protein ABIA07_006591 [Bradyrhizobium yuanmingense]